MRRTHNNSVILVRSHLGFTLIELMIVVALVAILATVGIPSSRQHVMKSNRAAAEAFMQQVANREEQYVLNARVYTNNLGSLKVATPNDVANKYTINVALPSPGYYTITAVPIGGQTKDTACAIVALDQAGAKGSQCTADSTGNVTMNTGTTPATMTCNFSVAQVCW